MENDEKDMKKTEAPLELEPEPGTWAFTARLMARACPDDGFDWDAWKDEMKERDL